ncbi:cyclic nucleotide-binding domain-containing protein [Luteimonas sp. e5]
MDAATVIDLPGLRRSCAQCSLQQLCLAGGMSESDLRRLDEIIRVRRPLEAGAHLFRMGDAMDSVFVTRDGAVKTVTYSEAGDEQIVGFHLPGELIGLDALANGEHRCEAVALTATSLCEIPFERLGEIAAGIPGLQQQLMRVIGMSVDRDQDHKEILVRRQANERIALFLHGLSERLKAIGRDPLRFRLPMSRIDIANYLGLALETVSRGFTRLEDDGLIDVHGRQLELLDAAQLGRIAHGWAEDVPRGRRTG